jgi:long-chain acyl-CoA synthetase
VQKLRTIDRVLDAALAARPDSPAVEAISGVWSYRELDDQARRAAGAMWKLGVRPGDRVAACLPNDLDIIAAFHGAQRIGAVWAGVGEALSEGEQEHVRALCEPMLVLAGPKYRLKHAGRVDLSRWTELLAADESAPSVEHDIDAPAAIAFTSGTSGQPKAVVHSQRNMLLPGAALAHTRGWGPDLRKGDSFPLTILNLMVLSTLLTAQVGGCCVIMNRRDASGVAEWIASHKITLWNGAPAQLYDLARRDDVDLSSLREVWSGGADTSDALRREFAERYGLIPRATYGLTEAPTIVSIDPVGADWREGSSGQVLPQYDVAAYDDDGVRLPPGELGELRLAATEVGPFADEWRPLLGYWENGGVRPTESSVIATGDMGTVDENGWLTVLDRKKLVIIRGGANIYPLEVERVISTHPDIAKVVVYPVPDDRLGERVATAFEGVGPIDTDALAELCREELSPYKVPEIWTQVEALPVNAMGKVQRSGLAEFVSAQSTSTAKGLA